VESLKLKACAQDFRVVNFRKSPEYPYLNRLRHIWIYAPSQIRGAWP